MMLDETNDIVIKLHDLARELEQNRKYELFGKDLRILADRLARVNKHYDLTAEEQFAYHYVRTTNGLDIQGANDV